MNQEEKNHHDKERQEAKSSRIKEGPHIDPVRTDTRHSGKGDKLRDTAWVTDPKIKDRMDKIFKKGKYAPQK